MARPPKLKNLFVRIPADLHRQFKLYAMTSNRRMDHLVADALRNFLPRDVRVVMKGGRL